MSITVTLTYFTDYASAVNGGINILLGPSQATGTVSVSNVIQSYPNYNYYQWRIGKTGDGQSPTGSQATIPNYSVSGYIYNAGENITSTSGDIFVNFYPVLPCFLEGSKILSEVDGVEKYVPVEELRNGSLVKTSRDGMKKVVLIGKREIENYDNTDRIEDRLYKCSPSKYPELTDDLYITGCHSILVDHLSEKEREDTIAKLGYTFVTDKKYRLMACVDERAEPWASAGKYTVWHFALEHEDDGMNYGVYANGGLLVESCSIRHMKKKSNMNMV